MFLSDYKSLKKTFFEQPWCELFNSWLIDHDVLTLQRKGLCPGPAGDLKRSPEPSHTHAPLNHKSWIRPCLLEEILNGWILFYMKYALRLCDPAEIRIFSCLTYLIKIISILIIHWQLKSFLSTNPILYLNRKQKI
jgi:hypothetical protein